MSKFFIKILIILTPFLLYQIFFCYLIDILLHLHKDIKPTNHEYLKIISYNMLFMTIALLFTLINLKLAKAEKYKLLVTCYILLVGIMGWVIDILSALNVDMLEGYKPETYIKYIINQSRVFLLAIGAIIFYWLSPWIITSKEPDNIKEIDVTKSDDNKGDKDKKSWW